MSVSRPLYATVADRQLYVERAVDRAALSALLAGRNVLVVGERGSGKTSLLYRLAADLGREGHRGWVAPLLVAESPEDAVALIYRTAAEAGMLDEADVPFAEATARGQDRFGTLDLVRRLGGAAGEAVVLVDDATAAIGHSLFGRLRDELWQLPLTWCVAVASESAHGLLTPPADAFFDVTLSLGLSQEERLEMVSRRLGDSARPWLADLIVEGPSTPRELLARASQLSEQGNDLRPLDLLQAVENRRAKAELAAGRAGAMLVAELETLGPVSASDERLLQRVGWTRPRTTDVLNRLEASEVVRAYEAAPTGRPGRPRKLYELRPPEDFLT